MIGDDSDSSEEESPIKSNLPSSTLEESPDVGVSPEQSEPLEPANPMNLEEMLNASADAISEAEDKIS